MSKLLLFNRVNISKDFIIVFFIFISPFLFFLYTILPVDATKWETNLFYLDIENSGFEVDEIFWHLSCNLLIIMIFSLWYVTCKHWWKYVILVPIIIELHKFFINYNFYYLNYAINDYEFFYSFLLSLPLIILLFIISKKLNYYSVSKSINKHIDDELNILMKHVSNYKNEDYKEFKKRLIVLRKQKPNLDRKEYLIKLIKLREDFALNN